MNIAVYKPDYIVWEAERIENRFHGYMTHFIGNYVDYIYAYSPEKIDIYRNAFDILGIYKEFEYIFSIKELNQKCDVLVMPTMTYFLHYADEIKNFHGLKIQNTQDYYNDCVKAASFYETIGIDYLIGHCQLDERCPLFVKYYSHYIGKVISCPFGFSDRFKNKVQFNERMNRALTIGSCVQWKDLSEFGTSEMRSMFPDAKVMTPLREYVYNNIELLAAWIDAILPSLQLSEHFRYDIVSELNKYRVFVNDEGIFNLPLCKTFEGIACGAVMIASDNEIYKDLGFVPEVNYIAYEKGNYADFIDKISYYLENEQVLRKLQENSLELAMEYNHDTVSKSLYEKIVNVAMDNRVL